MRILTFVAALMMPLAAQAQDRAPILMDVAETHVLPRFDKLPETTGASGQCIAGRLRSDLTGIARGL